MRAWNNPKVHSPLTFDQAVKSCQAGLKIILGGRKSQSLRLILQSQAEKPDSIAILIGPEGGLEEDEVIMAEKHGWVSASLHKNLKN